MSLAQIIVGIIYLITCLILITVIVLQTSKSAGLGSAFGGSDNFFGKNKSRTLDAKLFRMTYYVAIVFIALVLVLDFII